MSIWTIPAVLVMAVLLLRLVTVVSRGWNQYLGHLLLLLANLALAMWTLFGNRLVDAGGRPRIELVLTCVASVLIVGVPSARSRRIRRAFAGNELERAARLAGWKELFEPGQAATAERELYEQMAAARKGNIDDVVASLRQRLLDAEPPEDEAIQERIVTLLVFARRHREAIVQFEAHLGDEPARYPGLAIQMVAAYGEVGELARAADLVRRLEETMSPQDPTGQAVLLQVRLHLLAAAGAIHAVERILALDGLKRMPAAMRDTFLATARQHARPHAAPATPDGAAEAPASEGDAPSGDLAVHETEDGVGVVNPVAGSADQTVPAAARAEAAAGPAAAAEPPSLDEKLARFLEGAAERAAIDVRAAASAGRPLPPATLALVGINVLAFVLFAALLGETASSEHLIRGGASFHAAVRAGEWWRLWTAMFLHDGGLHLFFNVYGLFLLGRLVEPALGSARFLVIYALAGLAGNYLSVYNPNPAAVFSLGASGAVLGVMGALMAMLILRRGAWPERLRRGLLLNLVLLLAVQIAIGFSPAVAVVDNYAHLGGLIGGGLAAVLLAPGGLLGRGRASQAILGALLAVLAASAVSSVAALAREDPGQTLLRLPRERLRLGAISTTLPAGSHLLHDSGDGAALADPAAGLQIEPALVATNDGTEGVLAEAEKRDGDELRQASNEQRLGITIEGAPAPKVPGWSEAGQQAAGRLVVLYYARLVDAAHPTQVLVVRFIRRGGGDLPRSTVDEIRRVLAAMTVAPGAVAATDAGGAAGSGKPAPATAPRWPK